MSAAVPMVDPAEFGVVVPVPTPAQRRWRGLMGEAARRYLDRHSVTNRDAVTGVMGFARDLADQVAATEHRS